ncbi:LysR family transcriptional regulator [Glaciecola sp. SC05]|uniref:LysR family transcriptional regulator n=1 Tax=Glaciecola sp. SC05 TaxID=1987355 RepID=UPI003528C5A8
MDVRFFTTFLEVSKTRHFGKAAENLYLTPAAVSARIKQLEEFFSTTLFTRERNSIQLTPAGQKLLPYAQQLEDTLKQARQLLGEQDADFITCGATANASSLILDELLATCRAQFTNMAITTETHCTEQLSRQLHERTIDFAFTTEPFKSSDIETIALREQPLYLLSKSNLGDDAQHTNFVHIEWSSKASTALLTEFPKCKHYKLKTNDALAAVRYVNEHSGSIVLPDCLKHKLILNNTFNSQAVSTVTLYCARLKERPHPIVDEVITCLTA